MDESRATRRLATFASGLEVSALPPELARRVPELVVDLFASALRAAREAESTPALLDTAAALTPPDREGCRVLGRVERFPAPVAALVNGTLAHSLDFDDTHAAGSIHPSAPVVPAALAAAERCGASGATLLAGIAAGQEVALRLALGLGAADHYARGFHPTATCGAFGAAAAAGRVWGLDADAMADALGIALSQSAGSLQFLANGAWTKRFQVGWAAHAGVWAAALARRGFRGASAALEGERGFFAAYAPAPDPARALAGLGESWELGRVAVKPYPGCRYTHAAIDGLVDVRNSGVAADDVREVRIGLPHAGWKLVGDPLPLKQTPKSVVDAQFSMPFAAAVALRSGGLTWDDYRTGLADPGTQALCRRVRAEVDPRAEAHFPGQMSAVVEVHAAAPDGLRRHEREVVVPRGEPSNFPSRDEQLAKLRSLAEPVLGAARCVDLAATWWEIARVRELTPALDLLLPAD